MPDVPLTITIPDAYVTRTLHAFQTIADTDIVITSRGSQDIEVEGGENTDFSGSYHVQPRLEPQGDGEGDLAFGKRVVRNLILTVIRLVEKAEADAGRQAPLNAVPSPRSMSLMMQ